MRKIIFFLLGFLVFLVFSGFALAAEKPAEVKEELFEGRITKILEDKGDGYQKLEVLVSSGRLKGKKIEVEVGKVKTVYDISYKKGDEVAVVRTYDKRKEIFEIRGYVRRFTLFWLLVIFVVLAVIVGRWRGLASLASMAFTFLVIFKFILPQILVGWDPVATAIVGAVIIIPVTFYLSHGFNPKTTVAIFGTVISLVIVGILAKVFTGAARLTGFGEEMGFLQATGFSMLNPKGLLLAGIIIGVLGILDDVTVSQAAVVYQLKKTKVGSQVKELYKRAMEVGRDHIASMVNTLVLVYAGASLPLLLLFVNNPVPAEQILNYEILAEEIVRTLVGSIGLILAVPITTFLATTISFEE